MGHVRYKTEGLTANDLKRMIKATKRYIEGMKKIVFNMKKEVIYPKRLKMWLEPYQHEVKRASYELKVYEKELLKKL